MKETNFKPIWIFYNYKSDQLLLRQKYEMLASIIKINKFIIKNVVLGFLNDC